MSYAKDWRAYPPAFRVLIESAATRRVEVPCESPAAARSLQNRLHAFIGTLHKAALKDPEVRELDAMSRAVQIKAVDSVCVCIPRDLEPVNQQILAALGQSTGTHAGSPDGNMSSEMKEMFTKTLT